MNYSRSDYGDGEVHSPSIEGFRTFAPRPSRAELIAQGEAMRKAMPSRKRCTRRLEPAAG